MAAVQGEAESWSISKEQEEEVAVGEGGGALGEVGSVASALQR